MRYAGKQLAFQGPMVPPRDSKRNEHSPGRRGKSKIRRGHCNITRSWSEGHTIFNERIEIVVSRALLRGCNLVTPVKQKSTHDLIAHPRSPLTSETEYEKRFILAKILGSSVSLLISIMSLLLGGFPSLPLPLPICLSPLFPKPLLKFALRLVLFLLR